MLDLSQASVEYICKHVPSPNIARRFGYKLSEPDGVDRFVMRAISQAPSSDHHLSLPPRPRSVATSCTNQYRDQNAKYGYCQDRTGQYSVISRSPSTDRSL